MSTHNHKLEPILSLLKSSALQQGKFKDFLIELLPVLCMQLNARKTEFWLYRSISNSFEMIHEHQEVKEDSTLDFASFLNGQLLTRLTEEKLLNVTTNSPEEDYEDLVLNYLSKVGAKSWCSMQVWSGDRLFGILTCEWSVNHELFVTDELLLITASSMISQCHNALMFTKEEVLYKKGLKYENREREKLEKKLSDHAFYTSHSIRHPLSTILALIDLIKLNWDSRESYEQLLQQIKIETMNLDDAIRVMTAKIELD